MQKHIDRLLEAVVRRRFFEGKVLVVYGARQVGKTTLSRRILGHLPDNPPVVSLNGDMPDTRLILEDATPERIRALLEGKKILFIDEAQNIPGIGMVLKRIADTMPDVQVLVTGSSSFDLANRTSEPLTGRKIEHTLMPLSFEELKNATDLAQERAKLEQRLIFGAYIVSKLDEFAVAERTGNLVQNVNYALKSAYIRPQLEEHDITIGNPKDGQNTRLEDVAERVQKSVVMIISYGER